MERVLFAVLGTSPSVLTETVWALAHESPPTIPDRVVVLTTSVGREKLQKDLFDGTDTAWGRLVAALKRANLPVANRLRFGLADAHIRLIPTPDGCGNLKDVTSSIDNTTAADFIMRELRAET